MRELTTTVAARVSLAVAQELAAMVDRGPYRNTSQAAAAVLEAGLDHLKREAEAEGRDAERAARTAADIEDAIAREGVVEWAGKMCGGNADRVKALGQWIIDEAHQLTLDRRAAPG